MKIKSTTPRKRKTVLISASVLVLLVAGVTGYFLFLRDDPSNSVPSDSNHVADESQPLTNGTTPEKDKVITPSSNEPTPPDSTGTPEKPTLTRAEQSGDYVRVSAMLSQSSTGTCLLTLQKAGEASVTKTAPIIVGPSYYTCDGFRVSKSELPSTGEWTATVTHQLNGKATISDPKTLTVQ